MSCTITHVVSALKCQCGLVYVDHTKQTLKICKSDYKTIICSQTMGYGIAKHNVQADQVVTNRGDRTDRINYAERHMDSQY